MRKFELISKQLSALMAVVLFATQMYAVVSGPDRYLIPATPA